VFSALRQRCHNQRSQDVCDQLVSSCVFLRFICPAVLSPTLFGFTQQLPTEKASRNTTLVAKTIQSLANFSRLTEAVSCKILSLMPDIDSIILHSIALMLIVQCFDVGVC